jgi:pimeloyl-ACP methyl ester carboxylesterase
VLLHGFPEFWYGWKKQIPALVKAGYRVIIPDQRGYNLSSKPSKIADYAMRSMMNWYRAAARKSLLGK